MEEGGPGMARSASMPSGPSLPGHVLRRTGGSKGHQGCIRSLGSAIPGDLLRVHLHARRARGGPTVPFMRSPTPTTSRLA